LYASSVALVLWANIALKLSLCFFFLRILNQRYARYTVIGATALSTATNVTACLIFLISCGGPRSAVNFVFAGVCASKPSISRHAFISAGVYLPTYTNIAVDIVFSLSPIPMLLSTTLDRKQKITVTFYLALSTIGSICAIGKPFYTYGNSATTAGYISAARGYLCFNMSELAAYIIGGCIATYRPLVTAISRRINTTITTNKNDTRSRRSGTHGFSIVEDIESHGEQKAGKRSSKVVVFDAERGLVSHQPSPTSLTSESSARLAVPYSPVDEKTRFNFSAVEIEMSPQTTQSSLLEASDTLSDTRLKNGKLGVL
jgi:hypothetical protein